MKKLEEYETPETDDFSTHVHEGQCLPSCDRFAHDEKCPVCFGEYLMADFARGLERKLAMCRDALKYYQSNPAGMPGEFGRIADETLKATKPNS